MPELDDGIEFAPELPAVSRVVFSRLDAFAAVEEASAEPLLGTSDETLIAADSVVLMYGDGGTGKTTLTIDAIAHLAAGEDWLGFHVERPLSVAVIENEGPRGRFRRKLASKVAAWTGEPFHERVTVLEEPWAQFTFADERQRQALADHLRDDGVDVLVAGPLATIGMVGGGTPDEVNAFTSLLTQLRADLGAPLAIWLVHHESKSGDVSGAWSRVPDTLIHVRMDGKERSLVHWRKTRWASRSHGAKMTLAWKLDSAGFDVVDNDLDDSAAARAARIDEALDWVLTYVNEHPGSARTVVETAYKNADAKHVRNDARKAIDTALAAKQDGEQHKVLATGPGKAANGVYLYPASEASSPLAAPLFGEQGQQVSQTPQDASARRSPLPVRESEVAASSEQGHSDDGGGAASGGVVESVSEVAARAAEVSA